MTRLILGVIGVMCCCLGPAGTVQAATAIEIERSLQYAKTFLYGQMIDGTWEEVAAPIQAERPSDIRGDQWGGMTAIATYALLASGEDYQSPKLAKAIAFLKKAELKGIYAIGMRSQVWLFLPPTPEIKSLMSRDAQLLREMVHTQGNLKGLYDYVKTGRTYSLSRSQYGVLGMWAAAQMGIEVPSGYWKMVENAWLEKQEPDGGWRYKQKGRGDEYETTPGITAVGVATLFLTQDYLHADSGVLCRSPIPNPAIDKGMEWMARNMDKVATNQRYDRAYMGPTLYAVERIGVATGLRYIGNVNWYQKGADYLIEQQRKNGSWAISGSYIPTVADTSFCMLFLARGRAPVILGKLDYSDPHAKKPVNWNLRPRDVANVTRWIGRSLEKDLNWQVMNLNVGADDLNDAAVLVMSGNEVINLSEPQRAALKTYVEQGGLIVGHADCGSAGFAGSFRKLGAQLFPGFEFRELPAEHPIYKTQQYPRSKWKSKPGVLGLSNDVRELMLLIPQADPGKNWQLQTVGGKEEAWQLAANIVLYAVDKKNLRYRGDSHVVARKASAKPSRIIKLARLEYPGNWNPEPGGWRRLSKVLANQGTLDLQVETIKLGTGDLGGYKIAHLTGTTALKVDEAARAQLKKFLDDGGSLLVDCAGGSSLFATSMEAFLPSLGLGEQKMLPVDSPVYSTGGALGEIAYRSFAKMTLGNLKDQPRVQVLEVQGRPAVFYSREDISAGLVGQSVDGIVGYEPSSATEIVSRLVSFAAK